jgi:hypothetical protein
VTVFMVICGASMADLALGQWFDEKKKQSERARFLYY